MTGTALSVVAAQLLAGVLPASGGLGSPMLAATSAPPRRVRIWRDSRPVPAQDGRTDGRTAAAIRTPSDGSRPGLPPVETADVDRLIRKTSALFERD